jgi:hypothetical protein
MPTRRTARKQQRSSDENSEVIDSFNATPDWAHNRRMGHEQERAFVLPLDLRASLFHWNGHALRRCDSASIPRDAPWCADVESDVLCYADGNKLFAVRGALRDVAQTTLLFEGASAFRFHALALKDGVLFAGGQCEMEVVGAIDLQATVPAWRRLDLPAELRHPGKSVDSFVLDGDRLLALDDILLPKWWFVYDVSDARRPAFMAAPPLAVHSTYETYHHATLAHRHVVTVSTSINHGLTRVHLAFFNRADLAHLGAVTAVGGRVATRGRRAPDGARDFVHVDALDERVVLSADREGCAMFDLRALDGLAAPASDGTRLATNNAALASVVDANVRWCKREGGAAVRAFFCGGAQVAVSWMREDGGCWVELVSSAV